MLSKNVGRGGMKVYFDACCVNRLSDDQTQERIRKEAEAIEALLGFATREPNKWVASVVLAAEIERNPSSDRREDAQAVLSFAQDTIPLDDKVIRRAQELEGLGLSTFDALHVACAERGEVDVFSYHHRRSSAPTRKS